MVDQNMFNALRQQAEYVLRKSVKTRKKELLEDCIIVATDDSIKVARQYFFPKNFNWSAAKCKGIAEIVTVQEGLLFLVLEAVRESAKRLNIDVPIGAEMEYHNSPDLHRWLHERGKTVAWYGGITRNYSTCKQDSISMNQELPKYSLSNPRKSNRQQKVY